MLNADIISYRKMIPPQKSKSKLFLEEVQQLDQSEWVQRWETPSTLEKER